jgi:hypothetical protein
VFFLKQKKNTPIFFICIYLFFCLLADYLINPIFESLFKNYNLGIRIFTIFEYTLCSIFFYKTLEKIKLKKIIIIVSPIFLIYSFIDFYFSNKTSFDSIPTGLSASLVLFYSMSFLFEKINKPKISLLYNTQSFWITVGMIIYFSGTFFLFIFSQNIFENPEFRIMFDYLILTFSIIRNLFFAIAFLLPPEKENTGFSIK